MFFELWAEYWAENRRKIFPFRRFPVLSVFSSFDFYKEKIPDRMAEDYLYINCSKYFSLNPANGNLKSLCPPSVVV